MDVAALGRLCFRRGTWLSVQWRLPHGAAREDPAPCRPSGNHQAVRRCGGRGARPASSGVLCGALSADLGKQEPTPSRQTTAARPPSQQRDGHGPHRWSGGWRGSDADPIGVIQAGFAVATFSTSRLVQCGHCLVSDES